MKKLCVLGLGYIGLPTATMFANHGVQVVGVDVSARVVETLSQGEIHIEETGLKEFVQQAFRSGNLSVRTTPEPADAFIIAVPTPFFDDKSADMRAVTSATEAILPHLRPGNLVILESTSPPLTTVNLVQPILERSGLAAGKDFLLAYSPERVLPGKILTELVENARVIGGITPASAEAGKAVYATFVKGDILLTDATTAEMVKLMENTYRDVNIAIANEFALIAERLGVNVWEAIEIANRHPRVKILKPGPGVGGHCIAIDPWFFVEAAPDLALLIRQARLRNDSMPHHVVDRVKEMVSGVKNPVIACLGLTFKPDVDDIRESPAVEITEKLAQQGYKVKAYDPHVQRINLPNVEYMHSLDDAVKEADLAIILVDHSEFKSLVPDAIDNMRARKLFDTRNCLNDTLWRHAGFDVYTLGGKK